MGRMAQQDERFAVQLAGTLSAYPQVLAYLAVEAWTLPI
jgi:hypothetical protein